MPLHTDQLGRTIDIQSQPRTIVSLVPSQTELLHDLGLDNEVAGITKFCIHPAHWFRNKTRIGGTKDLRIEKIKALHPDLIIANKEENVREQVELLARDFPVWVSDVNNLDDALQMIGSVGEITGRSEQGRQLASRIRQGFQELGALMPVLRAAYLIWREPYMTVGGDTFIDNMLRAAGFSNIFGNRQRYPEVDVAAIRDSGCELLLLSSEPYPFRQKNIDELQDQLPGVQIILVDGELFSWYGSRLLRSPGYFGLLRTGALSLTNGARPR